MKVLKTIFPDRASAVVAAVLVGVLVLALALLEAMGGEIGSHPMPVVQPEAVGALTMPEAAPIFRPASGLLR
jgi:hypothetical protein